MIRNVGRKELKIYHMQVSSGIGTGVRKRKYPLSAYRTCCKCVIPDQLGRNSKQTKVLATPVVTIPWKRTTRDNFIILKVHYSCEKCDKAISFVFNGQLIPF